MNKQIARIVGLLFITGTVTGIMSVFLTQPLLQSPNVLGQVSAQANRMLLGALMVLVMGLSLALIPVVILPVLKPHNEILAHAYVVFRGALETVTYLAVVTSWLLLIPLSRTSTTSAMSESAVYRQIGAILLEGSELSGMLTAVIFPLGALMLYTVLYQSRLIPRWLSAWGLVAVVLHLAYSGLYGLYAYTNPPALSLDWLNFPIFLQEMVMAVWLIVKGFDAPALAEGDAIQRSQISYSKA